MRNEISAQIVLDALIRGIFESGTTLAMDGSFDSEIGPLVEQENTEIVTPEGLIAKIYASEKGQVLDFGCGLCAHRAMLEAQGYHWRGVNYREGMADSVRDIAAADPRIEFYDGIHLPYENDSFDVVFSSQVFEHIQDIRATFSEIARVLRPGGWLIGSMSYLEQVHDYSTFNFTPIGLKLAAAQGGMQLSKVYPSYDVFTWMVRRLLIVTSAIDENTLTDSLSRSNRIHDEFVRYGERMSIPPRSVNLMRLMFSAHFTFAIEKPANASGY